MKILVADKFEPTGIAQLESCGCEVAYLPGTSADSMAGAIAESDPDALVVRSTKVNGAAIQVGENLSLIVRAGAGYDSIDVAEASRRGVYVANCPGKNSVAVAELAWGLILSCDRRIPDQTSDLRNGVWNKKEYAQAKGLKGATLGIIGTGQIGREIAKRARAFEMRLLGWSRNLTPERAAAIGVGYCESLGELARQSDVVSVNVAANAETAGLIDLAFVDAMKPGAMLINTSRGSVVDHEALAHGIREKGIRAGLDVYGKEPGGSAAEFEDPIVGMPGVYGTHHVGASTDQAQLAIADEAVRIIQNYLLKGVVENCVNLATRTQAIQLLTVRHLNQPGVLAHVFEVLGNSRINVEEMENIVYEGNEAACAKIQLSAPLADSDQQRILENKSILAVTTNQI